jgi:hypothetical protein
MHTDDELPTDEQRKKLCELVHEAFVELRYFDRERGNDLAYALHNLPREMYGHGKWSIQRTRSALQRYQANLRFARASNTLLH